MSYTVLIKELTSSKKKIFTEEKVAKETEIILSASPSFEVNDVEGIFWYDLQVRILILKNFI